MVIDFPQNVRHTAFVKFKSLYYHDCMLKNMASPCDVLPHVFIFQRGRIMRKVMFGIRDAFKSKSLQ